jgi:uncharacterized protein YdeI (BOF family)
MWRQRYLAFCCAASLVGCGVRTPVILGRAPDGDVGTIATVRASRESSPATLRGVMVEKCPVAGCWFMLRDDTGTIKVDTKDAGFVVVGVPLKTAMTVAGKVVANGSDRMIQASGLRY